MTKKIETSYVSLDDDGEISTMSFIRRNEDASTSVVGELQGDAADFVRSLQKKKKRKVRKLEATIVSLKESIDNQANKQELQFNYNAHIERLKRENEQLKCSPEPRIKNLEVQLAKARAEVKALVSASPEKRDILVLAKENFDQLSTIWRLQDALTQIMGICFEQKYREDRETQIMTIITLANDGLKCDNEVLKVNALKPIKKNPWIRSKFIECPVCAAKPGMPALCPECLERRELFEEREKVFQVIQVEKGPAKGEAAVANNAGNKLVTCNCRECVEAREATDNLARAESQMPGR